MQDVRGVLLSVKRLSISHSHRENRTMRKINLDIDALKVESFETAVRGAEKSGTVRAREYTVDWDCRTAYTGRRDCLGCQVSGAATCVLCPAPYTNTCVDCSYTNGNGAYCAW
jgi:hypothetical protein